MGKLEIYECVEFECRQASHAILTASLLEYWEVISYDLIIQLMQRFNEGGKMARKKDNKNSR
jgi:hypothetical protein